MTEIDNYYGLYEKEIEEITELKEKSKKLEEKVIKLKQDLRFYKNLCTALKDEIRMSEMGVLEAWLLEKRKELSEEIAKPKNKKNEYANSFLVGKFDLVESLINKRWRKE